MCNLYSLTKGQAAIRNWFRARNDRTGNLPLLPGIFPDQMAPIVRNGADGERELVMARWGMPGPPQFGGTDHQHSQCRQPALARLAWQPSSLHCASDVFLRVRRHQAAQDAEMVRA
jgi:putative SOS response-associated peptidase YedK